MKSFTQQPDEIEQLLEFLEEDIENIRRVIDFCDQNDIEVEFEIHAKAETCEESVRHSPVEMGQVVKTLVFKAGEDFIAVLAQGDRRVDESKLEVLTGEDVRMANPDEVEDATGYVIGGVSPFDLDIPVYMDESILEEELVRPAAGSRVVGVNVSPEDLKEAAGAKVSDVTVS